MKYLGAADFLYPFTGDHNVDVWEDERTGERICLSGWNGEQWNDCWKIDADGNAIGASFEARPIYRYDAESIDLSALEENSPEWDRAVEIVDIKY